jgi:hypothetical protein
LPLTSTSPIISYWNIVLDLRPLFEERNWDLKQGTVYTASQFTLSHILLNAFWQVTVYYANPYLLLPPGVNPIAVNKYININIFHYFFFEYSF